LPANPPSLSRRAALRLLGAASLASVAGCRPSKKSGGASEPASGTEATSGRASATRTPAAKALAARVADDERQLIAAYDAAIAAQPELTATLEPLRASHAAHLVALVPGATPTPASARPTSATPTPSAGSASAGGASSSAAGSPAQSLRAQTLAGLAARERAAAAARVDGLMSADDGSLARLLASIGGCEAVHAALLAGAS
jgi:hypothetical protein